MLFRTTLILLFCLPVVSYGQVNTTTITKEVLSSQEDSKDINWYLALLNHVYYDFIPNKPVNNTFKAMVTYIPGNDYYLTIVPSVYWQWNNRNTGQTVSLNDIIVTLSHGSLAGGSPGSTLINGSRFSWALTATVPVSNYSRESSLITSLSYSVTYTKVFNNKHTSIGVGPYLNYAFRRYRTSLPTTKSVEELDSAKIFNVDGLYFEKLNPYVQLSTGAAVTFVHNFVGMTYFIAWINLDALRFYDDTVIIDSMSIQISPAVWRTTISFGQKLFFPITDLLWGDFALNSTGPVAGFCPFSVANGNSMMLSVGLSYFF